MYLQRSVSLLRDIAQSLQTHPRVALRAQGDNGTLQLPDLHLRAVLEADKFAPQAVCARGVVLANLLDQVVHVVARHTVDLLHQHTLTRRRHGTLHAPVQRNHRHRVIHTGKPHNGFDVLRVQGLKVNALDRGAGVNMLVKAPANRLQRILGVDHLARVVEVVAADRRHDGKALGVGH